MLSIPLRLVANLLRLVRLILEWVILWPVVLLRSRQRNFVRIDATGGFRLDSRRGLAAWLSQGPSYEGLCRTLDRAERTRTIEGVLVRVPSTGIKLADAELLRDRLLRLRAAGKRVVCTFESADIGGMTIASAADTVLMVPAGRIMLPGLKAELTFLRSLLGRFGLRGQFLHIGRYKTAGHMFSRERSSPPQRRMTKRLLEGLSREVVTLLTRTSRRAGETSAEESVGPAEPWSRFDRVSYSVSQARRAGLIDHQAFPDQIATRLRAERAEEPFDPFGTFGDKAVAKANMERLRALPAVSIQKASSFNRLRPRPPSFVPLWGYRPQIAVVEMSGMIVPDEAVSGPLGSRPHIAPGAVRRLFKRLRESRRIRAVVLAIDSRGGSALASDLIWREVRRLRHKKPVVAALRAIAASGGYYFAVGADEIVAETTTLTGSIGVVAGKISGELALGLASIHTETLEEGRHATLLSPRHAWTPAQIELLRDDVRDSYRRFVNRVATGRRLDSGRVHLLARGQVYTGRQAVRRGLVDGLGSIETAVDRASDRAGISRRRVQVRYFSLFAPTLKSLVLGGANGLAPSLALIDPDLPEAFAFGALLRQEPVLAYFDGGVHFDP